MLHGYTQDETQLMQNQLNKVTEINAHYVALAEQAPLALIRDLTNIRLYQTALPAAMHTMECAENMKQAELLFDAMLNNRQQEVDALTPLLMTLGIQEKMNDLSSLTSVLRRNVFDTIARDLAKKEINIDIVIVASAVNEIGIKSNCTGLKSYGFFSTLNQTIKTTLNSRTVRSSILWQKNPRVNYLNLQLNAENRSFTSLETNLILQALLPYCTVSSKLHIISSGALISLLTFADIFRGSQENVPSEDGALRRVNEMVSLYHSNSSIQSFSESPPTVEETTQEAERVARKQLYSSDPLLSDRDKRFRPM